MLRIIPLPLLPLLPVLDRAKLVYPGAMGA